MGIDLDVSQNAREHLAKVGFDPKMGARPLARIVDNEIKKPLSQEILFGKLEKGGRVLVDFDVSTQKISFKFPN
jgi:ATP-dependent Clp protease ATP-binding subunit ClpA